MKSILVWLRAFRLRTLPLSLSGIILGTALARYDGMVDERVFILSILTTLLYQILSNLANDLGDFMKGTDNEGRVGPKRSTQSGEIAAGRMKMAIVIFSVLALLATIELVASARIYFSAEKMWIFLTLGGASVMAAIFYTIGKKAYGYNGLGDVMVFLFFGLVAVVGVYNLYLPQFSWKPLIPAIAIGFLCSSVLNLNNMRDWENDKSQGKNTLVVRMSFAKAKIYHTFLILGGIGLMLSYFAFNLAVVGALSISSALLVLHLIKVWRTNAPAELDPHLKIVALLTFIMSLEVLIFLT